MPISAFGRSRWFGDDEQDGPTPLFPATAEKQSLFPVASDSSPVLGALKSGWKGLGDWLNGPAASDAGKDGDLLGYQPTNRWGAISDALGGAAKGVMHARGPYANWLGEGMLGATEGMAHTREHDLELRKLAQEQQYKQAAASLAKVRAATAMKQAEHAGEYNLGRTHYSADNKPLATAPPEEMSEADKARIANEDRRIDLEGRRADQTEAYQRAQLAQGAAGQGETARYHQGELAARGADLAQRQAAAADAAKLDKSGPERDRTRMVGIAEDIRADRPVKPEDMAWYERVYRETGQDKTTVDASGGVTKVTPDITDLPPPPSQAGKPPPVPGVSQAPVAYPQKMVDDARTAHASYASGTSAVDRTIDLLNHATPIELANPASEVGARLRAEALVVQNGLGKAQDAGVLQQGDIQRFEAVLGDLTGPMAGLKAAGGVKQAQAALAEIKGMLRTGVETKLPRVVSEGQLGSVSLGMTFLAPNGHVYRRDGPGKDDFTDLDAGRK